MAIKNAYIKELIVDNYKSLRNTKVEFQNGFNIIIGKNGVGKSNLLDFIYRFACKNLFTGLRPKIFSSNFSVTIGYLENRKKSELSITFRRERKNETPLFKEGGYNFTVTLNKSVGSNKIIEDGHYSISDSNSRKEALQNENLSEVLEVYRYLRCQYLTYTLPESQSWLTKPNRIEIDKEGISTSEEMFSRYRFLFRLNYQIEIEFISNIQSKTKNDESLLKGFILGKLDDLIESSAINETLSKYTIIEEIRINPNLNIYLNNERTIIENLSIEFLIEKDWMPWSYLSDGTKRLFYIISETIFHNSGIILIEEPELGIHPHQLYKLIEFLKEQSINKQIILSTHSPLVLDGLKEDELSRIIIGEYKKGSKFKSLTKPEIAKAKRYMNEVGELSYYWLHSDLEI